MANLKGGYVILDLTFLLKKYASKEEAKNINIARDITNEEKEYIQNVLNINKPIIVTINDERIYQVSTSGITIEGPLIGYNIIQGTMISGIVNMVVEQNGPATLSFSIQGFSTKTVSGTMLIPQLKS